MQAEKLIEMNFGPGIENINKNLKSYDVSFQHIKRFFTADVLWTSIIKARHERVFNNVKEKVQPMVIFFFDLEKNSETLTVLRYCSLHPETLVLHDIHSIEYYAQITQQNKRLLLLV